MVEITASAASMAHGVFAKCTIGRNESVKPEDGAQRIAFVPKVLFGNALLRSWVSRSENAKNRLEHAEFWG